MCNNGQWGFSCLDMYGMNTDQIPVQVYWGWKPSNVPAIFQMGILKELQSVFVCWMGFQPLRCNLCQVDAKPAGPPPGVGGFEWWWWSLRLPNGCPRESDIPTYH